MALTAESCGLHRQRVLLKPQVCAATDLNDQSLVANEQRFQRSDDSAQVRLVSCGVVEPLGVEDVVHGDDVVVFAKSAGADTSELLHVTTDAEQEAEVDAEGSDVGAGLARDPEDGQAALVVELEQLGLVDGAHTELTLDSGDERRALEEGTGEGFEGFGKGGFAFDLVVETKDADVLLTGALLGLDESGGSVNANGETARDFGVQGAAVARLFALEDATNPGDDFVGGRV